MSFKPICAERKNDMKKILIMGLPGSGKTTLANQGWFL